MKRASIILVSVALLTMAVLSGCGNNTSLGRNPLGEVQEPVTGIVIATQFVDGKTQILMMGPDKGAFTQSTTIEMPGDVKLMMGQEYTFMYAAGRWQFLSMKLDKEAVGIGED